MKWLIDEKCLWILWKVPKLYQNPSNFRNKNNIGGERICNLPRIVYTALEIVITSYSLLVFRYSWKKMVVTESSSARKWRQLKQVGRHTNYTLKLDELFCLSITYVHRFRKLYDNYLRTKFELAENSSTTIIYVQRYLYLIEHFK